MYIIQEADKLIQCCATQGDYTVFIFSATIEPLRGKLEFG